MSAGRRRLADSFARCQADGRAALIAFLAAGDPDLETTSALAAAAADGGADVLELGVPFSDPLADGPIIQNAYTRALAGGATVPGVLAVAERITASTGLPVVLMSAFNPILAYGPADFCRDAADAGAAGLLVPDLLPEDGRALHASADRAGLATVCLAVPGMSDGRLAAAARAATGFLYLISRPGVTGPDGGLGETLEEQVARARARTDLPIAVGFGVSSGADAARVAAVADGVIAGSVLVRAAHEAASGGAGPEARQAAVRARVAELAAGIRGAAAR